MGNFKNKVSSFLNKIKIGFYRFMYGRYGSDTLNNVILGVYAAVVLIFFVLRLVFQIAIPDNKIARLILEISYPIISVALISWVFFRMFSKKIAKRRRENERFCGFFKLRRNKFKDRKTHVYRKCPDCKAVLRLPKSKGKHTVVCPRCKKRFEVKG